MFSRAGFTLLGLEVSPVASYGYKMSNSDKKGYFSGLKFNNFLSSIPGIRIKIRNWIPIHTDLNFVSGLPLKPMRVNKILVTDLCVTARHVLSTPGGSLSAM
jgi:hypothetical protein